MKQKYAHIALTVLLLVGSTGFTVNSHFCGEILKAFTINAPAPDCCDTKEMPEGCCHDESQQVTVDDYQVQQTDFSFNPLGPVLFTLEYFLLNSWNQDTVDQRFLTSNLPLPTGSKIFVKIQSFLI